MTLSPPLGYPYVHVRTLASTNVLARELAQRGAPHGTMVSAEQQTAGHGRQGRAWQAPVDQALTCSWVLREPPRLTSLAAGVAVAGLCGPDAMIKWPNDVLIAGRKVAGILVEGRPQHGWAVLGIGINAAVELAALPAELRDSAGTLGLESVSIPELRERLCRGLSRWLAAPAETVLASLRARDALHGKRVRFAYGDDTLAGIAAGVDDAGRLRVRLDDGRSMTLAAGEVHLLDTP